MRRDAPLISVVISVFNEVQTLPTILCKLQDALNAFTFEIVDDESTDGTTKLIRQLNDERVLVFFHRKNQDTGAALRTALPYLIGQIVVILDADPSYDPIDIPKLVQPIIGGCADVVFGSRFHGPAQRVHLDWHRLLIAG
jgi:dolichol-phosphate mannosyltransferase